MKIKAILTGATGMVGEGVLHECLQDNDVEHILVLGRKSCGVIHPKLSEITVSDFFDLSTIEDKLAGYNACFFCLGVSSVGMKEEEYYRLTHELTLNFARVLSGINPDMTFCYISGSGTDSTEQGNSMWARIKGKTENDLLKLPFKKAFMFRPGYMQPTKNLKNTLPYYRYVSWLYPLLKAVFPRFVSTLGQLGQAMIQCSKTGYRKPILEVVDIVSVARLPKS